MKKLKKSLKLTDVVAICVGAMFSSGFFLLPGLAFAHTGPSVFLAYVASGILILPSMLSQAELSTAMPKAGGTYFFLDRAFGPIIGTIGGLGTFLGLVLKTAFALVGFGAYLQLYVDIPIKYVAAGLGVFFMLLNIVGAKESGKFQKILVSLLVLSMGFFILEGLRTVFFMDTDIMLSQFNNFFAGGISEFFYTIAFVFVSYAGLTKVASVAEEIENPDTNIPLGMIISLVITTLIYGLGVFVVVALVPADQLMNDLKPIATAEQFTFSWIKGSFGVILVAAAALSAFASTGNAGILASSRYPLAMAKDKLIPTGLSKLNKSGIPVRAILVTGMLILFVIFTQSEEGIAKFASAFQLLLFIFINSAVIIMRESKINTYDPGYKSPFYPWLQIIGITVSFSLLIYMGTLVLASMLAAILLFFLWFYFYAAKRVVRRGAILHWFARLGQGQFDDLESELWDIMKQKGVRDDDPIIPIVTSAKVLTLTGKHTFESIAKQAAQYFAAQSEASESEIESGFIDKSHLGSMPMSNGLCMAGLRLVGLKRAMLMIVRCPESFSVDLTDVHGDCYDDHSSKMALFLVSPEKKANTHLRLMANWITQAENHDLVETCLQLTSDTLLQERLYLSANEELLHISNQENAETLWIGKRLSELPLPPGRYVENIVRDSQLLPPKKDHVLLATDKLILIRLKRKRTK